MKLTIGRIVRFTDNYGHEWPAIVTVVHSDKLVSLQAFRQADIIPAPSVPLDSSTGNPPRGHYTWHWPDRA